MKAYIKDNELKTEQIKILEEKLNVKSKEAN
jgi:hypothetical protein